MAGVHNRAIFLAGAFRAAILVITLCVIPQGAFAQAAQSPAYYPPPHDNTQYMDNDAYYQPYKPQAAPAQVPQQQQQPYYPQPQQQQQPVYRDNDAYYNQPRYQAPAAQGTQQYQPYQDNDANYQNGGGHFYNPMYDY